MPLLHSGLWRSTCQEKLQGEAKAVGEVGCSCCLLCHYRGVLHVSESAAQGKTKFSQLEHHLGTDKYALLRNESAEMGVSTSQGVDMGLNFCTC